MDQWRRDILQEVAEGRLSPEEAAERLDDRPSEQADAPPGGVKRVRLTGTVGTLAVIGEPDLPGPITIGAHRARYDGDALVIEAGEAEAGSWFQDLFRQERPGQERPGQERAWQEKSWQEKSWQERSGQSWSYGWGGLAGIGRWKTPLEVRMSPELPLEVELTAGSLSVRNLDGPLKLGVRAGTLRIERVTGALDVSVGSGTVVASARLTDGASRIRCELGSVTVALEPGSSAAITARAHIGKVLLPGHEGEFGAKGVEDRAVVGEGAATFDIETSAGVITVTAA